MNKKTVSTTVLVAMLVAVSLYFIGGTYARYATEFTGDATATVAKWAVKLSGDGAEDSIELNLEPTENEFVVDKKIAPTTTVSKDIEVSLDGTEVAVDFTAELKDTDIETILGEAGITDPNKSKSDLELKTSLSLKNEGSGNATLEGSTVKLKDNTSGFTAEDVVVVTVSLTWDEEDSQTNNVAHTEIGKNATLTADKGLKFPVTIKAVQHVGE